jgi:hypothetical protein
MEIAEHREATAPASSSSTPLRLLIMRHAHRQDEAQPDWAAQEAARGGRGWDPPLSATGRAQADAAAARLLAWQQQSGICIAAVLCSPFLRCLQTAAAAARALGVPVLHLSWSLAEALCRLGTPCPDGPLPQWMWSVPAMQQPSCEQQEQAVEGPACCQPVASQQPWAAAGDAHAARTAAAYLLSLGAEGVAAAEGTAAGRAAVGSAPGAAEAAGRGAAAGGGASMLGVATAEPAEVSADASAEVSAEVSAGVSADAAAARGAVVEEGGGAAQGDGGEWHPATALQVRAAFFQPTRTRISIVRLRPSHGSCRASSASGCRGLCCRPCDMRLCTTGWPLAP